MTNCSVEFKGSMLKNVGGVDFKIEVQKVPYLPADNQHDIVGFGLYLILYKNTGYHSPCTFVCTKYWRFKLLTLNTVKCIQRLH